jgi:hypothetical protein
LNVGLFASVKFNTTEFGFTELHGEPPPVQVPAPIETTLVWVDKLTVWVVQGVPKSADGQLYVRSPLATKGPVVGEKSDVAFNVIVPIPELVVVRARYVSVIDPV